MEGKASVSQRLRRCAKNESFVLKSSTYSHKHKEERSQAHVLLRPLPNLELV